MVKLTGNINEEARSLGIVVPLSEQREPAAGLAGLMALVDEDMSAVNRIILDKALSDVEMIPELAHHLMLRRDQLCDQYGRGLRVRICRRCHRFPLLCGRI